MMYKAFSLIGVTAALFLSQGCGGKKKEVASSPAPAASQPSTPAAGSTEKSNEGTSSGPAAGGTTMLAMPGGNSGGNSGGVNSGGDSGGADPNSTSEGESQNSGGGSMSGGMPPKGGASMSGGMPPKGGNRNSGGNQASQEAPGMPAQNNPARNNLARPTPKIAPPPTLKEQSVYAFQSGNPKRAYTLLQSHALTLSDEEAAEILQHYRWSAHKKRLQLGLNIAVGVTVKNPQNVTDLSPIGAPGTNNGGGGLGGSGLGEMGMMGKPSGGSSGGGFGAGNANAIKNKTLAETTGAFGTELVAAFKSKHESGAWTSVFSEYSLGVPSSSTVGATFAGNPFGGNQPGFQAGNSAPGGFGEGEPSAPGVPGGGGAMNSGNSSGMQSNNNPGGNSSAPMDSGGAMSGGGANSGGMGAGIPKGSSGGMDSGGMVNSGGAASAPPQFQGKGGMGLAGPGAPGLGGLSEPSLSGPAGPGMPGMAGPGNPGMSGPGMGNPDEPGAGMAGPGMFGNQNGNGNAFGNGTPNGGRPNPGPFAVGKLPAGSTPLAPCLTFIGVDETSKLMKKAVQEGYDGLMLFEVTVAFNNRLRSVSNDTFIRVVQPSLVAKEIKRVYVSSTINNRQYAKSQAKGDADGLEDAVEKTVKMTKEAIALQPIPAGMTPELIANKRIPSLASDIETSVIDRLSEVHFYFYKGFIDENQKADAFEKIASQLGRSIAMGTDAEKKDAVEKLLERELKQ